MPVKNNYGDIMFEVFFFYLINKEMSPVIILSVLD